VAVLKKTTGKAVFLPALLFFLFSCGAPEVRYERAPSLLPGTDRQMKTAGYWIGRHPAPDRLFLDPSQIERLNRYVAEELKRTRDLLSAPEAFPREDLLPLLEEDAEPFGQGTYYGRDGDEAEPSFLDSLDRNRNMGGLPERIVPRPALVVRFAEQRVFPAADPLYAKRGDLNFDELQMSSLDVGTPLLAVLESLDGAWVYVLDPLYRGWVKKENVAFCTRDEMERYMRPGEFAVVTAAKADLYLDARRTKHHEYARMGVRFPLAGDPGEDGTLPVLLPLRREDGTVSFREGFVSAGAARRGFLPLRRGTCSNRPSGFWTPPTDGGGCTANRTAPGSSRKSSPPRGSTSRGIRPDRPGSAFSWTSSRKTCPRRKRNGSSPALPSGGSPSFT